MKNHKKLKKERNNERKTEGKKDRQTNINTKRKRETLNK